MQKSGWLLVLVGWLAGACAPSPNAAPDAAVDVEVDAAPLVTVTGHIWEQDGSTPIAGARMCILDHPEIACGTTDGDGVYTTLVPPALRDVDFAENSPPGTSALLTSSPCTRSPPGSSERA